MTDRPLKVGQVWKWNSDWSPPGRPRLFVIDKADLGEESQRAINRHATIVTDVPDIRVGQVWDWGNDELFTIMKVEGPKRVKIRSHEGGTEWWDTERSILRDATFVRDPEPTPLDLLAAAAVAFDRNDLVDELIEAARSYARSAKEEPK
jgi:hypothetical protein